jgi:hypothetical protein
MWDIIPGRPGDRGEILELDDLAKLGQALIRCIYSLRFFLLLTWCVPWLNSQT